MNIAIIGTGYVGLTLSALTARVGHKTYCIDVVPEKIDTIKTGKSYFYELGLDNLVKKGVDSGNLIPTLDYEEGLKDADVIFLSVGTPSGEDGGWDLSYIFDAVQKAAGYIKDGAIFVQRSTVPVGTGERAISIIRAANPDVKFTYLSCPEYLREGSAVLDSLVQDRIVIGGKDGDEEEIKKVFELFKDIEDISDDVIEETPEISKYAHNNIVKNGHTQKEFDEKCMVMGLESAELVKVCSNTLLATKITFANNVARVCDRVGANITEVMDGVGMDKRISRSFLYSGLGYGGGCFPKDVKGLIRSTEDLGVDASLFNAVNKTNMEQVDYVINQIKEMGVESGCRVGVLGLSFKPGTSDMRVSPAGRLCKALVKDGYVVKGTDPQAVEEAKKEFPEEEGLEYVDTVEDVFKDANVVILATDWPEYKEMDYSKYVELMAENIFFDARNCGEREKMSEIFEFDNVGS